MKKRIYCFILSALMVLSVVFPSFKVSAEGGRNISPNVTITDFKVTTGNGQEFNRATRWEKFTLKIEWDAKNQSTLNKGDYFEVELPENFRFLKDSSAVNFNVYGLDGTTVFGKGTLNIKNIGGGTLRIVLNEKVENLYNVKGTVSLESVFFQDKIQIGQDNKFKIEMNGKSVEKTIHIDNPKPLNEVLGKWPSLLNGKSDVVDWSVRFNVNKKNFKNVVIEDQLTITDGNFDGLHYIKESFKLQKAEIDEFGDVKRYISEENVGDRIELSENGTKFKLVLGDIDNAEQYMLRYQSTYKSGIVLKNKVKMTSQTETYQSVVKYGHAISSATIDGDLLGKIKIFKVDEEDNQLLLKGAKFKITNKENNQSFELVTNENGEAVSSKLVHGKYEIKEIEAPEGWIKNDEALEVEVKDDVAVIKTITNKREKTEVKVNKTWVGEKSSNVVVKLLANGVKVDEVTLNDANNWEHKFTNLNKFENDGKTEVKYTVEEEQINGYTSEVTENAKNDFTITNKKIESEKVNVSVEKKWVGKALKEIEVKLLANGNEVESVKLNDANSWKHTFNNLPKVDENNKEIVYTVKEVQVSGYDTTIEGNAKDGFVITNKEKPSKPKLPKTSVGTNAIAYMALAAISSGLLVISKKKKNR